MAKLLCISSKHLTGSNIAGDIIGAFDDKHEFSKAELDVFDIVNIPDYTAKEVQSAFSEQMSKIEATKIEIKSGTYFFTVKNSKEKKLSDIVVSKVSEDIAIKDK